tara:strand:- start:223 stop:429 length:207 start_codon:yes stop_codon:yes gene_type:complete
MDVGPPEKRICKSCKNLMTLNLFCLNGDTCRYCERGIEVPKHLRKEVINTVIKEVIPISNTEEEENMI